MLEILIPVLTAVIGVGGTLLAIWLKHYLDARRKKDDCIIDRTVKEDTEIITKLDEIKDEIGADRVSIFSFHNGGEYYSGKSMQKLSCSYEVVQPGVSRTQMDMLNIPVSACLVTLQNLMENKEFHCYDVEKNYPESACKFSLLENGVKSTYQYAIYGLNKKAIGLLRTDFVLDKKELSDEAHSSLKYTAIKLSGYLLSK
jgi:hypothetical protein